jgi:hypothetical protein
MSAIPHVDAAMSKNSADLQCDLTISSHASVASRAMRAKAVESEKLL